MSPSSPSGAPIWIVSAWSPEQDDLLRLMARGRPVEVVNDAVRIVGPYGFLCTGIGTHRASMRVATALMSSMQSGIKPTGLFFIATAGAYDDRVDIRSAHMISAAKWSDGDLASGRSYLPQVTQGEVLASTWPLPRSQGIKPAVALSTPGITLDADLAKNLSSLADLENLEVFGVALAAQQFGVPWASCLGVSNRVGAIAHEEWKRNHLSASQAAQRLLLDCFPEVLTL